MGVKWRGAWGGHSCGEGGVSRGASGGTSRGWMLLTAPSRWLAVAVVVVPLECLRFADVCGVCWDGVTRPVVFGGGWAIFTHF